MEHSQGALDFKLVVFIRVLKMTIFNFITLMIIKTKTQDFKGIRKEERNEIIVNCKFANGLLNPIVFDVCITCMKKLLQLLPQWAGNVALIIAHQTHGTARCTGFAKIILRYAHGDDVIFH